MTKKLKMVAASAALCGVLSVAGAHAQGLSQTYQTLGLTDMSSILGDFNIATQTVQPPGTGSPILVATTQGGAKFLVAFFSCADTAKAAGCKQVLVSTAQPSGGVDFNDINTFNGQSSVTTAVYEPTNQILIFGRNIYAPGGIGRDNVKLHVQLFLSDMQKFMESRRSGAKSVAFSKKPDPATKISSITAPAVDAAPNTLTSGPDADMSISLAIDNSLDVSFTDPAK